MPAFLDSVDSTNDYDAGICGEKIMTLDSDTPNFLSIIVGEDPITNDLTIKFND